MNNKNKRTLVDWSSDHETKNTWALPLGHAHSTFTGRLFNIGKAIKASFVGTNRSQYLLGFELFSHRHVWYSWCHNLVTRWTTRNSRNFLQLWPSRQNQYCQNTARFRLAVVLVLRLRTKRRKSKNAKYLAVQLQYWYASLTKYICQEIVLVIIPPLTPPWPLDVL